MAEEQQQQQQYNHQLQQQALLAGRAESTIGGDAAAKKFYNTFRALRGNPNPNAYGGCRHSLLWLIVICADNPTPKFRRSKSPPFPNISSRYFDRA